MQNRRRVGVRTWWEFFSEMAASAASIFSASAPAQSEGPKNDELGVFEQSAQEEIQKLRDAKNVWRNEIIRLLGSEELFNSTLPSLSSAHADMNTSGGMLANFDLLKEDVLELIRTPSAEMKVLMSRIKPKFEQQKLHVDELIKQLHAETDLEVQKNIKVQICKINMHLIENFIALISDVKDKIQSSITVDVLSEEIGLSLLGATMFLLAQIIFPQIDLEQETRNYMGKSIRENVKQLDQLLISFEGELALALRHVASDSVDDVQAAGALPDAGTPAEAAADAAALAVELATPVSSLGMFARGGADMHAVLRTSQDVVPDAEQERRLAV